MKENYPIYVHWYKTLKWCLDVTDHFPKSVRSTLTDRINNLALDILEDLIQAIYSKDRKPYLNQINLNIEKLRVFFQICHERQYINIKQWEYVVNSLNEAGNMVGGWKKSHD